MVGQNVDFSNLALAEDQWLFLECYDMHDAAEGGHLEVLKWLKENGCRGTQPRAMKLQAQSARDHQVGKGNGCPWSEKQALMQLNTVRLSLQVASEEQMLR